jgi:rSAM/selenodomain-associated transferase 1
MKTLHRILDPAVVDPNVNNICALAVMTKAPRPGYVKTRLVPPLTHDEATRLNICFLRDTAAAISRACGANSRGIGAYTPVGAEAAYVDILPNDFELIAQRGDGFGDRLVNAIQDLLHIGFASVCLIDSDSPTVSNEIYARAVEALSTKGDRIVLGPSDDGGYYLIGLKQLHRRLFEDVDWSTERVFEQTKARAAEIGLAVELLPACYDVDDSKSLERLCDQLLSESVKPEVAPQTRDFLAEIVLREGRERIWSRAEATTSK